MNGEKTMLLSDLIPFLKENKNDVKIHFAHLEDALAAFITGDFKSWQEEQNQRNFEKTYILSLIRLDSNEWLFAGIYKSFGAKEQNGWYKYRTRLEDIGSEFIGRAIITYNRGCRQPYCLLSSHLNGLEVAEIRRSSYTKPFPGYKNVDISWKMLKAVIDTDEWKRPLSDKKGVYLITDTSNGAMYVGSATGERKIYGRWKSYIRTGHGGNAGLKRLSKKRIMNNFRYAILDVYSPEADDSEIRQREKWWKKILMSSKNEYGYNHN